MKTTEEILKDQLAALNDLLILKDKTIAELRNQPPRIEYRYLSNPQYPYYTYPYYNPSPFYPYLYGSTSSGSIAISSGSGTLNGTTAVING